MTLPPGKVAKGFKLNNGFQPKGLLKGIEVAPGARAGVGGPGVDMIGSDTEGFVIPLAVVVTKFLGPGIC